MAIHKAVITLAALACGGDVVAQTSNCMNMGGGMTHCDSMGPNGAMSSTNCTSMGGGMANCNTMDMSQPQRTSPTPDMSRPQTGGSPLGIIGDLIAQSQERSFQKKLGGMLSSGDCKGAADFAFAKGHYETSSQIRRSCQPKSTSSAAATPAADQFMAGQQSPSNTTPSEFDLDCIGTDLMIDKNDMYKRPFEGKYRISLSLGRWCEGDCELTKPIAAVDDTRITLSDIDTPLENGMVFLNRESAELIKIVNFMPGSRTPESHSVIAKCERRIFSAFPKIKFWG